MKKVCLQAGHVGRASGATGAPGEREWTQRMAAMVATRLVAAGISVTIADAKANTDSSITSQDWDLFLAIHYDADVYDDSGGFVDFADPAVDQANKESRRIASAIRDVYFPVTGINNRPNRSNSNTKFYYMWNALSAKTPCVLIECGVGWRKPEDWDTLYNRADIVADGIANGIKKAFGIEQSPFNFNHTKKIPDEAWDMLGYENRPSIHRADALDTIGEKYQWISDELRDCETTVEKQELIIKGYLEVQEDLRKQMSTVRQHIQENLEPTISEQRGKIESLEGEVSEWKEKHAGGLEAYTIQTLVKTILRRWI